MKVTVVHPQTETARAELASRVAAVHAEHIMQSIRCLRCSTEQKQRLLDTVICKIDEKEYPQLRMNMVYRPQSSP